MEVLNRFGHFKTKSQWRINCINYKVLTQTFNLNWHDKDCKTTR